MAFYFAWADPEETTFVSSSHAIEEEEIFSFELGHAEGEFAQLDLEIINPKVGLLNAGRKRWAWLSYDNGSTVTPLFFGRLIGIPQSIAGEIIRISFIARPADFTVIKESMAEAMKFFPYWDPLFFTDEAKLDPDSVLESRPEAWHIDRVTHAVTTSNIALGEDGNIDFGENVFYDSVQITNVNTAARVAKVTAQVSWKQMAVDVIDISGQFPTPTIKTLTGIGLLNKWPQPGKKIGRDWEVEKGDPIDLTPPESSFKGLLPAYATAGVNWDDWGAPNLPMSTIAPDLHLRYNVERDYVEIIEFSLEADVQPILTDPGDEEIISLNFSGEADILHDYSYLNGTGSAGTGTGAALSSGDTPDLAPIRDRKSRRYFSTLRGSESVKFLIAVARAHLIARARAVTVTFEVPFDLGLELSCRKNATFTDSRIPGGSASGKVTAYSLGLSGDDGKAFCRITISCMIGNGGSETTPVGDPTYVSIDYDGGAYTYQDGAGIEVTGDVHYIDFSNLSPPDDGIQFDQLVPSDVVESITVYNEYEAQIAYAASWISNWNNPFAVRDPDEIKAAVNEVYTEVELTMRDFEDGPFELKIPLQTSQLKIVKTIDMGAA